MSNFHPLEKRLAKILSCFPRTKRLVKKSYVRLVSTLLIKENPLNINYELKKISYNDKETFFGYYDKSPVNYDNNYIIFHSTELDTKQSPDPNNPINIILNDYNTNECIGSFQSFSYNWQQGSRLQWIDNNHFIFNDYDFKNNHYLSKIVNTVGKIETIIDYPIYDCYSKYALSFNFDRLAVTRPDYGYRNRLNCTDIDIFNVNNDGIFLIDLFNNTSQLIIPIESIINHHYNDTMENAQHWFNHIMISPDGEQFLFLHRWLKNNRRYDSLFLSDLHGNKIKCLADDEMVSHFCWKNNNEIVAYMRDKNLGDKYYLINIHTGKNELFGIGKLDQYGDGHPSIKNSFMLYDTYPNNYRMKELFIFDIKNKNNHKIGDFFESLNYYEETRCDLHPRWTNDDSIIAIDSVHSGKRQLYLIDISSIN